MLRLRTRTQGRRPSQVWRMALGMKATEFEAPAAAATALWLFRSLFRQQIIKLLVFYLLTRRSGTRGPMASNRVGVKARWRRRLGATCQDASTPKLFLAFDLKPTPLLHIWNPCSTQLSRRSFLRIRLILGSKSSCGSQWKGAAQAVLSQPTRARSST